MLLSLRGAFFATSYHRLRPRSSTLTRANFIRTIAMDTSNSQRLSSSQINCGNVKDSYNNTWNNCDISVTDERRQILEWLSPLAPRKRHRDVRASQVEGVGDWVLRTDEFVNWCTGEDGVVNPVLFCYGDPGVGKTHVRYNMRNILLRRWARLNIVTFAQLSSY